MTTKALLIRRWRKVRDGNERLYWRSNNRASRNWDRGETARIVDYPVVTHFYGLKAVEDEIVLREEIASQPGEASE